MANSTGNFITRNLRGKFGGQVIFMVRDGKSIMANVPRERRKELSEKQKEQLRKFKLASLWARSVLVDPELKSAYKAAAPGSMTAYAMAMTNYLRNPEVTGIDASAYSGNAEERIGVAASDFFRICSVTLRIVGSSGEIIEEGSCTKADTGEGWEYITTVQNPELKGTVVSVTVKNLPKHEAEMSVTV